MNSHSLLVSPFLSLISWSVLFVSTSIGAEPDAVFPTLVTQKVWPGAAPDEDGSIGPEKVRMSPAYDRTKVEITEPTRLITNVTEPTITLFRPAPEHDSKAAVIVFPGGGYWDLYYQIEGEEVAEWLRSVGVTGIVLKYRVPRRPGEVEREPAKRPLQDAQRAIRLVRSRAKEWGIDTEKVGVVGFSAGGHLAVSTATNFETQSYEPMDDIDRLSCRPNFAISVYPGYLKDPERDEVSSSIKIPKDTPPIFFAHGSSDIIAGPEHSVLMYLALKRAGVSTELHVYADSAHDFGVRQNDRTCGSWTESCVTWMRAKGFLRKPTRATE